MACPGVALLNHHKKPQIETTNLNKNRRRLYVVLYGKCCILISIRDVWMWTNRSLFEEAVHWTDNSKDYSRAVSWYQLGFRALSTKVNSLNLISTGSIKVMKMHVWKLLNPLRLMPRSPFTFWIRDHMDQSETRKGWANVESDESSGGEGRDPESFIEFLFCLIASPVDCCLVYDASLMNHYKQTKKGTQRSKSFK